MEDNDLAFPDEVEAFRPLADALGWRLMSDSGPVYLATSKESDIVATVGQDDAIRTAEAEIARRGLMDKYTEALRAQFPPLWHNNLHDGECACWLDTDVLEALITAPPEARVRAMLEVLKE